jgi:uncharacterized membrane protein
MSFKTGGWVFSFAVEIPSLLISAADKQSPMDKLRPNAWWDGWLNHAASDISLLRSAMAYLLSPAQRIAVVLAAIFYVVAGSLHFMKPGPYLKIVPPYIPWPGTMVRVSGAFEIFGGLGLLASETRKAASWGLIALLIAVFPANIYMATHPIEAGAVAIAPVLRWVRLPLQVFLVWWLLWCTRPPLVPR